MGGPMIDAKNLYTENLVVNNGVRIGQWNVTEHGLRIDGESDCCICSRSRYGYVGIAGNVCYWGLADYVSLFFYLMTIIIVLYKSFYCREITYFP